MKAFLFTISLVFSLSMFVAASYGSDTARVTFTVHCYTVGEHALKGQPGVLSVEPGWRHSREVDRVVYDPEVISIAQMEELLRQADTYVDTVEMKEIKADEKR